GVDRRNVLRAAGALGVTVPVASAMSGSASAKPSHGKLTIRKEKFGRTPDGEQVDVYIFGNGRMTVSMLNWGATVQRIEVPDRRGRLANVSLGFDNIDDYLELSPSFGSTIGRYANRIAGGRFTLDGETYQIPTNDGDNA